MHLKQNLLVNLMVVDHLLKTERIQKFKTTEDSRYKQE